MRISDSLNHLIFQILEAIFILTNLLQRLRQKLEMTEQAWNLLTARFMLLE